jgi:hypothetical protein
VACPVSIIERPSRAISISSVKIVGVGRIDACHRAIPAVTAKIRKRMMM